MHLTLDSCGLEELPDLTRMQIQHLSAKYNKLRFIDSDPFPRTVESINMHKNYLHTTNIFGNQVLPLLKKLDFGLNSIAHIHDIVLGAPALQTLILVKNDITQLSNLQDTQIEELSVCCNPITFLDGIPSRIKILNANECNIRMTQSRLPDTLEELYMVANRLKFGGLPLSFGNSLRVLSLSYNELQKFPRKLPDTLEILLLNDNFITEMPPTLPRNLHTLILSNNKIRSIPDYLRSNRISLLFLSENQITTIDTPDWAIYTEMKDNWNTALHYRSVNKVIRFWRLYRLQKRLRILYRTRRLRNELLEVSMHPDRYGQF